MIPRRKFLRSAALGAVVGTGIVAGGTGVASAAQVRYFGDGVNLQPAYYCGGDQDLGWDRMNMYSDIDTVRIELEPPSWGEAGAGVTLDDYKYWIDMAEYYGYDVIATCHHYPYNGDGETDKLTDAAWWWASSPANKDYSGTVYDYLSQDSSFTMNLMNEWGDHHQNGSGTMTTSTYADAYNEAIGIVRNNTSYSGEIIIDIPGYAQEYHVAADAASQLNDQNIVFSAHVYPSAYNGKEGHWVRKSDLNYLNDNSAGYDCIIGEFGPNRDGGADWSALVDHAKWLGWPVMGWAWNGDSEADPMNMVTPFWGDDCADSYYESAYFDTVYNKLGPGFDPNQQYRLTAVHSGKVLDVNGGEDATDNGDNIHQWDDYGNDNQRWYIEHQYDDRYRLTAAHSGKVLDVRGGENATSNGANVHQWDDYGNENQQWYIDYVGGGRFKLTAVHSGRVLDVNGGEDATDNGVNVHQWDDYGNDNQRWEIEPV